VSDEIPQMTPRKLVTDIVDGHPDAGHQVIVDGPAMLI
jgi:hypothetical protein